MSLGPDSMFYWLGEVAEEQRLKAHEETGRAALTHIANTVQDLRGGDPPNVQTLRHFEMRHRPSSEIDDVIRAYEIVCGLAPLEIWKEALRRMDAYLASRSDEDAGGPRVDLAPAPELRRLGQSPRTSGLSPRTPRRRKS